MSIVKYLKIIGYANRYNIWVPPNLTEKIEWRFLKEWSQAVKYRLFKTMWNEKGTGENEVCIWKKGDDVCLVGLKGHCLLRDVSAKSDNFESKQVLFPTGQIKESSWERASGIIQSELFADPIGIWYNLVRLTYRTRRTQLNSHFPVTTYFDPCRILFIRTLNLKDRDTTVSSRNMPNSESYIASSNMTKGNGTKRHIRKVTELGALFEPWAKEG